MIVRLRQLLQELRNGLSTVPLLFSLGAVALAFGLLQLDAHFGDDYFPVYLRTSEENARSVLSTIAGGLISAVALMLSLALVAIQLGSSQYSPRTLTNWLGDRILQIAIGLAVGTVIYCLVVLQTLDNFAAADGFVSPHRAVLLALVLGLGSIVGVVRSVDHLAKSLRVGTVAQTIMAETLELIYAKNNKQQGTKETNHAKETRPVDPGGSEFVVEAGRAGWVQQIDQAYLLEQCPENERVTVLATVGSFTLDSAPLLTVTGNWASDGAEELRTVLGSAIAIGPTRTMQQDVGFGFLRLVDIALRALSPGVNDPNTAIDVTNHIGTLLLAVFEAPKAPELRIEDTRSVVIPELSHVEYLNQTLEPIRHAAQTSPLVLKSIVALSATIVREIERRQLPTDPQIFQGLASAVSELLQTAPLLDNEKQMIRSELEALESLLCN